MDGETTNGHTRLRCLQWYFSVVDVVQVLTELLNPTDYLKKLRKRDQKLGSYLGTNCPQVAMRNVDGKVRKILAGSRTVQAMAGACGLRAHARNCRPRAEHRPRPRELEKLGRSKKWIQQRMTGQETRNKLTDYWQTHGLAFPTLSDEEFKAQSFAERKALHMFTTEFLITSLIVVLIPGTGVVFTVSTGLSQGRRASILASLGCTLGIVPHLLATVLGLAAVMHTSALAFQLLKYAGVAYLFYLAVVTWRDQSAFTVQPIRADGGALGLVTKAFLLNILNPKLTIFFLAFLPQFIQPDGGAPLLQLMGLSGVFMVMTFGVFVVYGLLAHAFRKSVIESPRVQTYLRRSFATAFAGLGTQLAFSER